MLWQRALRLLWDVDEDDRVELAVESIQVNPARALAAIFSEASVDVYADGLMSYGPTREKLPLTLARRVRRLLHLDLVPGLRPLLLSEYGVEPVIGTPDRAVLRALHFYAECDRVKAMARAITRGDMEVFLQKVVECGHSSFEYNQNAYSPGSPEQQDLPVALALSQTVLNGRGAWRLQGGGFAGTIQAFVPDDLLDDYRAALENVFGEGACHVLWVRGTGCTQVSADNPFER